MGDHREVQGAVPGGAHTPETLVRVQSPQPSAMQSRRMSLIEAIANVAVGYGLAVLTQIAVFPMFGLQASLGDNLALGSIFTVVSIARSYALRRLFEAIRVRSLKSARQV